MMMSSMEYFLQSFFSPPNRITLRNIEDPSHNHAKLLPFLERMRERNPLPTVLPYWEGSQFTWFAVAYDDVGLRQLREDIRNLLGATYAKIITKNHSDVTEQLVSHETGGHYFAFTGDDAAIGRQLQILLTLWQQRPEHTKQLPVSFGKTLAAFHTALQTGSKDTAENLLSALEQQYAMDARNALFLRVHMLASFEQWEDLLQLSSLKDLLQTKKPFAVTEAIMQAIYQTELLPFEADVATLVERFRERVYPAYGNLFRYQVTRFTKPEMLKSFMLRVLAENPNAPSWLPDLINHIRGTALEPLFDQWRSTLQQPSGTLSTITPSPQSAHEVMLRGEYAHAFALFEGQAPSKERARHMIYCAAQLLTLEQKQKALEALQKLSQEEQREILENPLLRRLVEEIQGQSVSATKGSKPLSLPRNWLEWIEGLSDRTVHQNIDLAQSGSREWDFRAWVEQTMILTQLVEKWRQSAQDPELAEILDCAIPFLLANLRQDTRWAELEWRPIHWMLLQHLIVRCKGQPSDFVLVKELATVLVNQGLDKDDSYLLHDQLRYLWKKFGSIRNKDWLLGWLEVCVTSYCPDDLGRTKLAIEMDRTLRDGYPVSEPWLSLKRQLLPSTWEEWLKLLRRCHDEPQLLLDVVPMYNENFWQTMSNHGVTTMTEQILQIALDPLHPQQPRVLLQRLQNLIEQMVKGSAIPNVAYKSFYSSLIDLICASDECNTQLLDNLNILLHGRLYFEPREVGDRWHDVRQWLIVKPNVTMASSVYEMLELFMDYNVPGEEVKYIWDMWTAELIPSYSNLQRTQLTFLFKLGTRCQGSYALLQQLQTFLERIPNTDPVANLKAQKISIFSCREHASKRAADEIMKRNANLRVRVCSDEKMSARAEAYAQDEIVVIVTTCISHAIYYGIIPYVSKPVYPRSSGESAIIEAIEQHASSLL